MPKLCTIPGCERAHNARGWCQWHYRRWKNHGDPLYIAPTTRERYEAGIDRVTTPDGCHPWVALTNRTGYGVFALGRRPVLTHRWGYEHLVAPIPDDLIVRHTCDNPPCQNPKHWLLGTRSDNSDDKISRGRQAQGEGHGQSKLTAASVMAIRQQVASGETVKSMADRYGISPRTVNDVISRKSWRHVDAVQ